MDDSESSRQVAAEEARLAYRPAELAALVGLSCKAIYRAIERGELRAAKVAAGSRLLIPVEEAEAWLQASLVEVDRPDSLPGPSRRPRSRQELRPLGDAIASLDLRSPDGYDRSGS